MQLFLKAIVNQFWSRTLSPLIIEFWGWLLQVCTTFESWRNWNIWSWSIYQVLLMMIYLI